MEYLQQQQQQSESTAKLMMSSSSSATTTAPDETSIPSLQELCVNYIVKDREFHKVDNILILFTFPIDFDNPKFTALRTLIYTRLHEFLPYLINKYSLENLEMNYPSITWRKEYEKLEADRKETEYFLSLKGSIIERTVVNYDENSDFFPYQALKAGVVWPRKVDPSRREQYLDDDEFVKVMGMTKGQFGALPSFKRVNMKKDKGLF
jgi:hypothetical protein